MDNAIKGEIRPPTEIAGKKNKKGGNIALNVICALIALLLLAVGFTVSSVSQKPEGEQQLITGAKVLFRVDFSDLLGIEKTETVTEQQADADNTAEEDKPPLVAPLYMLTVTETQVNSLIVVLLIGLFCFWLTRNLKVIPESKKQIVAEWIVEKVTALVHGNMSQEFTGFAPFITALISLSAISSLTSLLGWYPPTAELNTIVGWSVIVFILITYEKLRAGLFEYLKGYTKPIFIMAPLNLLGEIATPLSMTFRHFGNVCSGLVISALLTKVLTSASSAIWGLLGVEGLLSQFAFLRVGIPAVFSLYFDIFSGCLQAFIFCMLTMINIYLAYDDSMQTRREKAEKKAKRLAKKKEKALAKESAGSAPDA